MEHCTDCVTLSSRCEVRGREYLALLQMTALKASSLTADEFWKLKQDLVQANAWRRSASIDLACHQRKCSELIENRLATTMVA
jgi:hypothetical protein